MQSQCRQPSLQTAQGRRKWGAEADAARETAPGFHDRRSLVPVRVSLATGGEPDGVVEG